MARIQNSLSMETVESVEKLADRWGVPFNDRKHLINILQKHLKYTDDIDELGFDSIVNDGIALYKKEATDPKVQRMDVFSYKNNLRQALLTFADKL